VLHRGRCLQNKFLCRDHFLPTDFMTPEGICLINLAVPCGLDLASHSIPQASPPSKLPFLSPLQLPSELTPEEISVRVLPFLRTFSKLPLSSALIVSPQFTPQAGQSTRWKPRARTRNLPSVVWAAELQTIDPRGVSRSYIANEANT